MTRAIKALERLYPSQQVCLECGHRFMYHGKYGCNIKFCSCSITNQTFREYVSKLCRFSFKHFIPIE